MPKDNLFSPTQEQFITTFTEEFVRELQFIVDVSRGRGDARPSFFDQLIGKINVGTSILGTLTSFFPAVSVAVGTISQVTICIATGFKYLYEADMNSNIERVVAGAAQPEILLRLMIEGVAREAARRHEFFLNSMCDPDAVDLFAIVGVARILQYLSDHKDTLFTSENLIKGLMEGKSGAGQQGFQNNQLPCRHASVKTLSAETVYGHSAHMDIQGRYYIKEKTTFIFKSNHSHYVKMLDKPANNIPKAGVMLLRETEIATYGYAETPITPEIDTHLVRHRPGYIFLNRAQIEAYITSQRSAIAPLSLREHYGNKGILCRDDLSGLDLERGDFSGVDFAGAKFIHAKLNGANFEKSYLVGVDLSHAEANHVNFRHANLSLVSAESASFVDSDFIHAQVFCSVFTQAVMTGIQFIGSEWNGSDLSTIITSPEIKADLHPLSIAVTILVDRQGAQETRLIEIERRIGRYLLDQDQRVARSVAEKIDKVRQSVLNDKILKEVLDLYIPVQGALNRHSAQHFDLEQNTLTFLASDKKVMLLMGNAGEGKSTFNLFMHRKLWTDYTPGKAIPIFISLPTLEKPATKLLSGYFKNKGFTAEEIDWLRDHHAFIFILDGYDEMNSTPNLYNSNKLSEWQAQVIISCRSQYFAQGEPYSQYFAPVQAERRLDQAFQEVTTVPFNPKQIADYIPQYLRIEWYRLDAMSNIPQDSHRSPQPEAGVLYFRIENDRFFYQMNSTSGLECEIQTSDFLAEGIEKNRIQEFFQRVIQLPADLVKDKRLDVVKAIEPYKHDILKVILRRAHISIELETQRNQDYLRTFELNELVATPFLLMMALRVIPAIVKKYPNLTEGATQKIAKSELYDEFMKWWFRRGAIKVQSNPNIVLPRSYNLEAEFKKISEELAIEMKHADVMQVHYQTSEQRLGNVYGRNFDAYEIVTITAEKLKDFALVESDMLLLYIRDCQEPDKRWRIVARNNAGGLTYHAKTGWLTVTELERRWSARTTSIIEHKTQVREKAKALQYALQQLNQYTPESLSIELKNEVIFPAIILGLTHPWEYFFNLDDEKVERLLPGVPVQPTERGGYMYIHAEVLNHLYTNAIKREAKPDMTSQGKRKPWDLPPAAAPAMAQHGIFPAAAGNTIIYQTIVQQAPPPQAPVSPPLAPAPKKSTCSIS